MPKLNSQGIEGFSSLLSLSYTDVKDLWHLSNAQNISNVKHASLLLILEAKSCYCQTH